MSKERYFVSLAFFAGITSIFTAVALFAGTWWHGLILGALVGAMVSEIIYCEQSFTVRAFLFFFGIAKAVFLFWLSFLKDSNSMLFMLGVTLASPLLVGAILTFAVGLVLFPILAPFFFLYHAISLPYELD